MRLFLLFITLSTLLYPASFIIKIQANFGGDKLVDLGFYDTYRANLLFANDSGEYGVGLNVPLFSFLEWEMTMDYAYRSLGYDNEVSLTRIPAETLALIVLEPVRLGAGVSYDFYARYDCHYENICSETGETQGVLGYFVQVDFRELPENEHGAAFGLRYSWREHTYGLRHVDSSGMSIVATIFPKFGR
ncbi:MAG: hypothetical protein KU37_03375 [Sulfuricurvum sp. PC08-66]|nr:MAG: hypothetical protein KU37_03375 [Sulfuricurvum sp. PC08-66]